MNAAVAQLFDLSERVAIVTGGTKGLGRSIAFGLAGAELTGSDFRPYRSYMPQPEGNITRCPA